VNAAIGIAMSLWCFRDDRDEPGVRERITNHKEAHQILFLSAGHVIAVQELTYECYDCRSDVDDTEDEDEEDDLDDVDDEPTADNT
jgi:hypothetical protein